MGRAGNPTDYAEAVLSLHAGRGTQDALWHPETIVNTLRQLERGRITLKHLKTALLCFTCQSVQRVEDVYPDKTCVLACGCKRPANTLSTERYKGLVEAADGLKVKEGK